MIGGQYILNPHDSSILVAVLSADIEDDHREVVIEVSEAKLGPYIFLSCIAKAVPSMGLTSNYWHISLNFSLNFGSDLISSLYRLANSFRLAWKLAYVSLICIGTALQPARSSISRPSLPPASSSPFLLPLRLHSCLCTSK